MTNRHANREEHDSRLAEILRWVAPAEQVPAYGIVKLVAVTSGVFVASKPDGGTGLYYANGHGPVPSGKNGESIAWVRAQPVLFEPGASVAVGETCGPIESQWYMGASGTGWRIFIPPNGDDIAFVVRDGNAGRGGMRARVTPITADCNDGTVTVDATSGSATECGTLPGADQYGVLTVYDPYEWFSGSNPVYSKAQIEGATWLRIERMFQQYDCSQQWELLFPMVKPDCSAE